MTDSENTENYCNNVTRDGASAWIGNRDENNVRLPNIWTSGVTNKRRADDRRKAETDLQRPSVVSRFNSTVKTTFKALSPWTSEYSQSGAAEDKRSNAASLFTPVPSQYRAAPSPPSHPPTRDFGETSQGESDASRIHYTSVCGNLLLRGGNPPNFEHKNGVYKFGQPRPGDAQVVGRIDEAGRYINVSSLWFMWLIAGRNIRVYRR